jgi:hypothetical protein
MRLRMWIRLRRIRSPGHAANRLCPLGLAPAPFTFPPSAEWEEPSGSAETVCVPKPVRIIRMLPP